MDLACSFCLSRSYIFNKQDAASGVLGATITIPLDHFNSSDYRTFENRYWMNDEFYEPGGPIFFYDAGEAGVSDRGAKLALNNHNVRFAPVELAKKYHGIAVFWEHRFYGGSMPFPVSNLTGIALDGPEAYRYLNNEQALEDAVYFAKNFNPPGYSISEAEMMRSDRSPWVWIGASYPRNRAAMIRVRNPDVFFASWASSAPIQTQVENPVYYNTIKETMPKACLGDVHAAITFADEVLVSGKEEEAELVRKVIWLANAANLRNTSFANTPTELSLWNISQILSYPFQSSPIHFQSFGYERSLGAFCNELEGWNPSNFTAFTSKSDISLLLVDDLSRIPVESSLTAASSPKYAFYAYMHALVQKSISDAQGNVNPPFSPADRASWNWQLCTQNAQFHVSQYPSPDNIISRFYNLSNHMKYVCHGTASTRPDVDTLLKYGGWKMKPSNVMFTNGELDPWRALSVQSDTGINSDALDRKSTQVVPKCGEAPAGDDAFGAIWEGEVHGKDLRTRRDRFDDSPGQRGLELFGRALDAWLPCFGNYGSEDRILSIDMLYE